MKIDRIKETKEKVTLTLNPQVLQAVDRWCLEFQLRSRSAAIEHLLEESIAEKEKRKVEAETEAYYLSLSAEEKAENSDWTRISSTQAVRRFKEE